jgi:hypothetical protein
MVSLLSKFIKILCYRTAESLHCSLYYFIRQKTFSLLALASNPCQLDFFNGNFQMFKNGLRRELTIIKLLRLIFFILLYFLSYCECYYHWFHLSFLFVSFLSCIIHWWFAIFTLYRVLERKVQMYLFLVSLPLQIWNFSVSQAIGDT